MITHVASPPRLRVNPAAIHRIADRHVTRFTRTYAASIVGLRDRVTVELVAADMRRAMVDEPVGLYALVDEVVIAKADDPTNDLTVVYTEILTESAKLAGVLNLQSPFVHEAAKKLTANLITNVNKETKAAIRQLIFEAIRDGDAPAVAQKLIRETIGLTRRDALAVKRLTQNGAPTRTVERYGAKLLRGRAMNIARTETMLASNRGQQLAWRQMVSDNLLDTTSMQQEWVVTDDDRLCPECAPMDGVIVPLDGSFTQTERGVLPSERESYAGETVESPPLHASCRCCLVANFGE